MSISSIFKLQNKKNLITPITYQKMIENGELIVLLDVRTQIEYENEHINDAVLFPVSLIETYIESYFPDKTITYVLYCRSGIRSQHALGIMRHLGYNSVFDMGGIIDWPYEKTNKKMHDL